MRWIFALRRKATHVLILFYWCSKLLSYFMMFEVFLCDCRKRFHINVIWPSYYAFVYHCLSTVNCKVFEKISDFYVFWKDFFICSKKVVQISFLIFFTVLEWTLRYSYHVLFLLVSDVNICLLTHPCDHVCRKGVNGWSYTCSCFDGFALVNNTVCVANIAGSMPEPYLVVLQASRIQVSATKLL